MSSPCHLKHRYLARNLDMLEMRMLRVRWVHAVGMWGACHDAMGVWVACCGYKGYMPWVCRMLAMGMQDACYGYVGCTL